MLNKVSSIPYFYLIHIKNFIEKNYALPSLCALCNQYHSEKTAICNSCFEFLTRLGHACTYCAMPLPNLNNSICNACCLQKPFVDKVFTAYIYEEPLKTLLHNFKYQNGLYLTSLLCRLMLQAPINQDELQCLMPVPIHPQRLKKRGFNQAAVLAIYLAKKLAIPCDITSCKKIINTPAQAALKAIDRQNNLRNAFKVNRVRYKEITLVDDLFTTGNTANEIARALKEQGVEKVNLWCPSRANFHIM